MQFDLAVAAALVVVVWALVRPRDLALAKPYRWAAVCLVILALSPLLMLGDSWCGRSPSRNTWRARRPD